MVTKNNLGFNLPELATPRRNDPIYISLMRDLVSVYCNTNWYDEKDLALRYEITVFDIASFLYWWDNR